MDVLCSDKTGTLTKNELTIKDPKSYSKKYSAEDVVFKAALGVKNEEGADAIDTALMQYLPNDKKQTLENYQIIDYIPFNPTDKFTAATIKGPKDEIFHIRKGAPQVILKGSSNRDEVGSQVEDDISEFGAAGYRCIGVSVSTHKNKDKNYKIIGLIPLFDPPRDDTAITIKKCVELGIGIKMITGDQLVIAKETCRQLDIGTNIIPGDVFVDKNKIHEDYGVPRSQLVEDADGFAQVSPVDKYTIIKQLHKNHHIVGMTGDGVNDTAALHKADIGIAVAGATDAARSAADIVLKTPGLSVIVDAIVGSRKIFKRMKTYCTYSISMAVRVVLLFTILTVAYNWYFPTVAMVILAVLNDGCMMAVSRDRAKPNPFPDKWNGISVFSVAIAYGIYLTVSSIVIFEIAYSTTWFETTFGLHHLNHQGLVGLIYLQVSIGGLATIFICRSRSFSFMEKPGLLVIAAFVVAQVIASVIGAYGLPNQFENFGGCGWGYVLVAWVWCIIWYIPMDILKVICYQITKIDWSRHEYTKKMYTGRRTRLTKTQRNMSKRDAEAKSTVSTSKRG